MRRRMTKRRAKKTGRKKTGKRPRPPPVERPVQFKVVELSSVDEASLERTLNDWSSQGWTLDGVQFAMRESSKRPSMAFVLFTRPGEPLTVTETEDPDPAAVDRLVRLSDGDRAPLPAKLPVSAQQRLRELAGVGDGWHIGDVVPEPEQLFDPEPEEN